MKNIDNLLESSVQFIEELFNTLKENNLLNDPRVLNWLDKINEISVRAWKHRIYPEAEYASM